MLCGGGSTLSIKRVGTVIGLIAMIMTGVLSGVSAHAEPDEDGAADLRAARSEIVEAEIPATPGLSNQPIHMTVFAQDGTPAGERFLEQALQRAATDSAGRIPPNVTLAENGLSPNSDGSPEVTLTSIEGATPKEKLKKVLAYLYDNSRQTFAVARFGLNLVVLTFYSQKDVHWWTAFPAALTAATISGGIMAFYPSYQKYLLSENWLAKKLGGVAGKIVTQISSQLKFLTTEIIFVGAITDVALATGAKTFDLAKSFTQNYLATGQGILTSVGLASADQALFDIGNANITQQALEKTSDPKVQKWIRFKSGLFAVSISVATNAIFMAVDHHVKGSNAAFWSMAAGSVGYYIYSLKRNAAGLCKRFFSGSSGAPQSRVDHQGQYLNHGAE